VAMDRGHVRELRRAAPAEAGERIRLFSEFAPDLGGADVPDPYYGEGDGFELVLDMVEEAAAGLLAYIRANHL